MSRLLGIGTVVGAMFAGVLLWSPPAAATLDPIWLQCLVVTSAGVNEGSYRTTYDFTVTNGCNQEPPSAYESVQYDFNAGGLTSNYGKSGSLWPFPSRLFGTPVSIDITNLSPGRYGPSVTFSQFLTPYFDRVTRSLPSFTIYETAPGPVVPPPPTTPVAPVPLPTSPAPAPAPSCKGLGATQNPVTVVSKTPTAIQLDWAQVPNYDSYEVIVYPAAGGNPTYRVNIGSQTDFTLTPEMVPDPASVFAVNLSGGCGKPTTQIGVVRGPFPQTGAAPGKGTSAPGQCANDFTPSRFPGTTPLTVLKRTKKIVVITWQPDPRVDNYQVVISPSGQVFDLGKNSIMRVTRARAGTKGQFSMTLSGQHCQQKWPEAGAVFGFRRR